MKERFKMQLNLNSVCLKNSFPLHSSFISYDQHIIEKQLNNLFFIYNITREHKKEYLMTVLGYFSYFSIKTYVLGIHQKSLAEALLISTHNICYYVIM